MNLRLLNKADYDDAYSKSIEQSDDFLAEIAANYHWDTKWNSVQQCNMKAAHFSWFEGGKTNICFNAVDRHLEERRNEK